MEKLKMSILRGITVVGLIVFSYSSVWGANTVVVDSKTVCTGAKAVTIAVKLTNDRELRHVTVPLEIRTVSGGAFVTSLKMSWSDRMHAGPKAPLGDNKFANQYYVRDCPCGKNQIQGYGKIAFSDTLAHPIKQSPTGMLFSRFRMMGENLKPGEDSTGSFLLTDTTCVCPSHTLMFVDLARNSQAIFPTFKKGTITVQACTDKGK
jgi:hypothetical protein